MRLKNFSKVDDSATVSMGFGRAQMDVDEALRYSVGGSGKSGKFLSGLIRLDLHECMVLPRLLLTDGHVGMSSVLDIYHGWTLHWAYGRSFVAAAAAAEQPAQCLSETLPRDTYQAMDGPSRYGRPSDLM
jgi:hypothetical protein